MVAKKYSLVAISAVALIVGLAACSSSGNSTEGSTGGNSSPSGNCPSGLTTLKIVSGGFGTYNAAPYLAQVEGYAKEECLNLTVSNANSTVVTLVTSGKADLGLTGLGSMFPVANQGKQTQVVWGMAYANSSFAVGGPDVKALSDCKRVATNVIGLSGYAVSETYKAALKAKFQVIQVGNTADIVPSLVSGQNDCALAGYTAVAPALQKGFHLVVDPTTGNIPDPEVAKAIGNALWGLKSNLDKKHGAMVALMKALSKAEDFMKTHDVNQVAKELAKHPDMAVTPMATIVTNYSSDKRFMTYKDQNPGFMSEDTWKADVSLWGTSFPYAKGGTGPFSYQNMVNMTYLQAAS